MRKVTLNSSQLRRIVESTVRVVLNEGYGGCEQAKYEYSKYLSAADRLAKEGRTQEAAVALEKAQKYLMQLSQCSDTDWTDKTNIQTDPTTQQGKKDGMGPEMFGRGREFGRLAEAVVKILTKMLRESPSVYESMSNRVIKESVKRIIKEGFESSFDVVVYDRDDAGNRGRRIVYSGSKDDCKSWVRAYCDRYPWNEGLHQIEPSQWSDNGGAFDEYGNDISDFPYMNDVDYD